MLLQLQPINLSLGVLLSLLSFSLFSLTPSLSKIGNLTFRALSFLSLCLCLCLCLSVSPSLLLLSLCLSPFSLEQQSASS